MGTLSLPPSGSVQVLGDLPILPSSSGAGVGGGSRQVSSRGSPGAGGRAGPSKIPTGITGDKTQKLRGGRAKGACLYLPERSVRIFRAASEERTQDTQRPTNPLCVAS